jgi:hypothetical protein
MHPAYKTIKSVHERQILPCAFSVTESSFCAVGHSIESFSNSSTVSAQIQSHNVLNKDRKPGAQEGDKNDNRGEYCHVSRGF